MLTLSGIGHRFGATIALDGVGFDLRAGEVHGLIGHNGAGKSTLIRCLAGVLRPDRGTITLGDSPLALGEPAACYRAGLRFIHQNAPLVPVFDAIENCFLGRPYPRRNGMIDRRAMRAEVEALAGQLAPDLPLDVPAAGLSAGMRQLVLIIRALADRGRVLVLDEPTASLSASETRRLLAAITTLREQGLGLMFVSHKLDEVLTVADRITGLRDGRVAGTIGASGTNVADLVRLMGGLALDAPARRFAESQSQRGLAVCGLRTRRGGPSIDLDVRRGEVTVLYGRTGAGRSRVLSTIFGATPMHAGHMTIDGLPFLPLGPRHAIRRGIAYVPDDRRRKGIFVGLSLTTNVTLPRLRQFRQHRWLPVPARRLERSAFLDVARELRLVHAGASLPAATLSGGNQQKLLFGRWLASNPSLMLLDEPTEGVDVEAKAAIHRLIVGAAAAGAAVLIASSDRNEAIEIGDRIIVMRAGQIVGEHARAHVMVDDLEAAAQSANPATPDDA